MVQPFHEEKVVLKKSEFLQKLAQAAKSYHHEKRSNSYTCPSKSEFANIANSAGFLPLLAENHDDPISFAIRNVGATGIFDFRVYLTHERAWEHYQKLHTERGPGQGREP